MLSDDMCLNGEPPEVGGQSFFYRANKPHRCCECGYWIQPGQRYEYVRGCWEGVWATFRTCLGCHMVRQQSPYCDQWIFGALWSELVEEMGVCLWPRRKT